MSVQLSLLPKPEKPPPDPARTALWSTGLYNLASLLGMRNDAARRLLGRLSAAAKHDCAALSELIERAVALRPDEPLPWLIAGARKIGGQGDDPWGLRAWYAQSVQAQAWHFEEYEAIMLTSGLPESWHGSLAPLTAWIDDGYRPDSIAEVMNARAYSAARSLLFWDAIVRRQAARWNPHRAEWRVG